MDIFQVRYYLGDQAQNLLLPAEVLLLFDRSRKVLVSGSK